MKVIAVDYGSARTGVAVSDATGTIARPLGVVERAGGEAGLNRLVELIRAEEAERIVVGLPLTLRGEHGEQARATAAFVERLRAAIETRVELLGDELCCRRVDREVVRCREKKTLERITLAAEPRLTARKPRDREEGAAR